jgi:hypothetical protein
MNVTLTETIPEPSLAGLVVCTLRGTMNPELESDSDMNRTLDNLQESNILLGLVLKTRFNANVCRARRHIMDALTELRAASVERRVTPNETTTTLTSLE